jgi:hypothetical protein
MFFYEIFQIENRVRSWGAKVPNFRKTFLCRKMSQFISSFVKHDSTITYRRLAFGQTIEAAIVVGGTAVIFRMAAWVLRGEGN